MATVAIAAGGAEYCRGNARRTGSRKRRFFLTGKSDGLPVFLIGGDKRRCGCKWPDPDSGWAGSNLLVVEKSPLPLTTGQLSVIGGSRQDSDCRKNAGPISDPPDVQIVTLAVRAVIVPLIGTFLVSSGERVLVRSGGAVVTHVCHRLVFASKCQRASEAYQ